MNHTDYFDAYLSAQEKMKDPLYIKTPRGIFRFAFHTMEDANAAGCHLWFTHNGICIVGNGTEAYAVRQPYGT